MSKRLKALYDAHINATIIEGDNDKNHVTLTGIIYDTKPRIKMEIPDWANGDRNIWPHLLIVSPAVAQALQAAIAKFFADDKLEEE